MIQKNLPKYFRPLLRLTVCPHPANLKSTIKKMVSLTTVLLVLSFLGDILNKFFDPFTLVGKKIPYSFA